MGAAGVKLLIVEICWLFAENPNSKKIIVMVYRNKTVLPKGTTWNELMSSL